MAHSIMNLPYLPPPRLQVYSRRSWHVWPAKKAETLSPPAPGLGLQFHLKQATGASHAFQPCIAEIIFQVAQLRGPGHSSSNQPSLLG